MDQIPSDYFMRSLLGAVFSTPERPLWQRSGPETDPASEDAMPAGSEIQTLDKEDPQ